MGAKPERVNELFESETFSDKKATSESLEFQSITSMPWKKEILRPFLNASIP
jgi:hypothetical protein